MRAKAISVVTAAIVATPALATPASAVEYAGPTITSLTEGQTVSGAPDITAESQAPYVRFTEGNVILGNVTEEVTEVVPVTDGTATYTWQTVGFRAAEVTVTDCTTAAPADCTGPSTSVNVDVDAPTDTFDAPTGPVFTNPDVDGPVAVTVTDTTTPGQVYAVWNGERNQVKHQVTPGTPEDFAVANLWGVYDTGTFRIVRCNPVNDKICVATNTDGPEWTLRTGLRAGFVSTSPYWTSPNGDGSWDAVTAKVKLDQAVEDQTATWTVTDLDGTSLMPQPQPFTVDPDPNGVTTFTADPSAAGLTSGDYELRVDTVGTDHGQEFTGSTSRRIHVDVDLDRLTSLTPSRRVFYPYRDGYRDSVDVRVGIEDAPEASPGSMARVEVLDSADQVVRTFTEYPLEDGETFEWNGRDDAGDQVPEGTYRFRVTSGDQAGNRDVFTGGAVDVSPKRLVSRLWTRTFRARPSLALDDSGRCSKLRFPGLHGWRGSIGYMSQAKCKGRTFSSRVAAGIHGVRLPRALRYRAFHVSVYGGSSRPRTGHQAGLHYFSKKGTLMGDTEVLRPRVRWHRAGHRPARRMMNKDRYVFWAVTTAYGQRYDVAKFRVKLRYFVLR